jgi:glycosyltransferase involved in cell wall biosynthesis
LVSVLLPTTGRPQRAESCIKQLRETADVEIICAVDCDPVSAKRLAPLVDRLLVAPFYRGNSVWNDCLREATGDPIVFAADDLQWQPGWLEAALQALSEHPDCLIGFNDGHWGAELSTHYLMPRSFIVEVLGGVVAWPHYKHSFNDLETCERAKAAGRYHWCEDAHVHHDHWLFGGRAKDETDTRNLGGHAESERTYNERKAAGFPDDIPAVI